MICGYLISYSTVLHAGVAAWFGCVDRVFCGLLVACSGVLILWMPLGVHSCKTGLAHCRCAHGRVCLFVSAWSARRGGGVALLPACPVDLRCAGVRVVEYPGKVACPSGRRCSTRNAVWCHSHPGFKSQRYRHRRPAPMGPGGFVVPEWFPSNVARNSPATASNIESWSLELQRLWPISKNDRVKLRAKFGWGLSR